MTSKRGLFLLLAPAGLAALLGIGVLLRPGAPASAVKRTAPRPALAKAERAAEPEAKPAPAYRPPMTEGETLKYARVRNMVKNYRTAIAGGNDHAEQALRNALKKDRELAVAFAQEELAASRTRQDREIALRTLDGLRN